MCKTQLSPLNIMFFIMDNFVHPVEEKCEWNVDSFFCLSCPQFVHIQFTSLMWIISYQAEVSFSEYRSSFVWTAWFEVPVQFFHNRA